MNNIKKAGIIAGAVVGGVLGGTLSIIGKVSKKKFIDDLGESILDSTILTGGIAGNIASGATHLVAGAIQKEPAKREEGKQDLKEAGGQVIGNFVTNTKTVLNQSGKILDGVKKRDGKKVVRATKTLVKMAAVGAITVGAVKVKMEESIDNTEENIKGDSDLKAQWQSEADFAFQGWDFSHIDGRWESEDLSWDYKDILLSHLKSTHKLLDMGTGGGEFLLSLNHPFNLTSVTETYPPNVQLCRERLVPLGIEVVQIEEDDILPFGANSFDLVINRHESFNPAEIARVLKTDGYFITQQVGGKNNRDLTKRLIPGFTSKYSTHDLAHNMEALQALGFEIHFAEEAFPPIRFFDVGALVYLANILEWEFPGFSVDASFDALYECHKDIEQKGFVQGTEHRFIIVAQKR